MTWMCGRTCATCWSDWPAARPTWRRCSRTSGKRRIWSMSAPSAPQRKSRVRPHAASGGLVVDNSNTPRRRPPSNPPPTFTALQGRLRSQTRSLFASRCSTPTRGRSRFALGADEAPSLARGQRLPSGPRLDRPPIVAAGKLPHAMPPAHVPRCCSVPRCPLQSAAACSTVLLGAYGNVTTRTVISERSRLVIRVLDSEGNITTLE